MVLQVVLWCLRDEALVGSLKDFVGHVLEVPSVLQRLQVVPKDPKLTEFVVERQEFVVHESVAETEAKSGFLFGSKGEIEFS